MRIRIRDAAGNTQRVELPEICDLRVLRERVSAITGIPLPSVHISLNRREEVTGSPGTIVSSLGICSGDLLYLIDASPATSTVSNIAGRSEEVRQDAVTSSLPFASSKQVARSSQAESMQIRREKCAAAAARRMTCSSLVDVDNILKSENAGQNSKTPLTEVGVGGTLSVDTRLEHPNGNLKKVRMEAGVRQTVEKSSGDDMNVDSKASTPVVAAPSAETVSKYFIRTSTSIEGLEGIPDSVLRVLTVETQSLQTKSPSDILVVVVHAIMLETGLTLNSPKDSPQQSYSLPAGWSSAQGPLILSYNLVMASSVSCTLRFQTLGGFLLVYGTRDGGGQLGAGDIYRLSLRVIDYCGRGGCFDGNMQQFTKKIRELVVAVKDKLSLPLLTALCQQAGLQPLLSLLLLPSEVKMQVLQWLRAPALAACACTCSELRYLSAEDDLWKCLYQKEFGNISGGIPANCSWRTMYVSRLQQQKQEEEERRQAEARSHLWMGPPPMAPAVFPFRPSPGIIGGDYDRFPGGIGGLRGPGFGPEGFFAGAGTGWGQGAYDDNLLGGSLRDRGLGGAMGEVGDLPANSSLLGGIRGSRGSSAGLPPRSLQPRFQGPGRFI